MSNLIQLLQKYPFLFNTAVFFAALLKQILAPSQIRRYLANHPQKKLKFGSSKNILKGWLNTEILPFPGTVYLDLLKKSPFESDIFDYIYTEHVISIFEYDQALRWMKECRRILKPGGKIRISTSDLQFLIDLYRKDKTEVQKNYIRFAIDSFSKIKIYEDTVVINNFVRGWGNKFIYDFKTLKGLLESAGFREITPREVGQSPDPNLASLEWHGNAIPEEFNLLETFVVEAVK